jgi:hypothetical protein
MSVLVRGAVAELPAPVHAPTVRLAANGYAAGEKATGTYRLESKLAGNSNR